MPSFYPWPLFQRHHIAQQLVVHLEGRAEVPQSLHLLALDEALVIAVEDKSLRVGVRAAGSHVDEKGEGQRVFFRVERVHL